MQNKLLTKTNLIAVAALLIAGGTMSFKAMENNKKAGPDDDIEIYFNGSTSSSSSVAEETNWSTTNNSESCEDGDVACSMQVKEKDLKPGTGGARVLDDTKISLSAAPNGSGEFAPTRSGGSSTTLVEIHNRD